MAAPFFLNVEEVLTVLMAELPDGVYATDRADHANPDLNSYSSSELRAHAYLLSWVYEQLANVYADKFLTTVTEDGLGEWEKDLFSSLQDSTLGYTARQAALLAKVRATGSIAYPAVYSVVFGILSPLGLSFDLLPYGGQNGTSGYGAWLLGLSGLGVGSWLSGLDPINGKVTGVTPTSDQLLAMQATAYTYEVRIYGSASASTLAVLDSQLTAIEPARATHILTNEAARNPLDPSAYIASTPQFARFRL